MNRQKFDNFGELPKWSQCVIIGKPVTIDQAKEILLKTDRFFQGSGSNDHEWDSLAWDKIGLPRWDYRKGFDSDEYEKYVERDELFKKRYGLIPLGYLENDYISTCFIYGPHGWCHPDGTIHFRDNIGKWPEWDDIYQDCRELAKAFPFLDMKVYLFNQEADCEEYYDEPKECAGGFKIKNGRVYKLKKSEYLDPHAPECDLHYENLEGLKNYINTQKKNIFGDRANLTEWDKSCGERFFSIDEFMEYFGKFFNAK